MARPGLATTTAFALSAITALAPGARALGPAAVGSGPGSAQAAIASPVSPPVSQQAAPQRPDHNLPLARRAALPTTDQAATKLTAQSAPPAPAHAGLLATLLPLAGVLLLIMFCATVMRRLMQRRGGLAAQLGAGGRAPSGLLEVVARYPVSRGLTLVVLKLDRRILLVSQSGARSGQAMATLTEITDADAVASILHKAASHEGSAIAQRFRAALAREDADASAALADLAEHPAEVSTRPAVARDAAVAMRAKLAQARAAIAPSRPTRGEQP